MSHSIQYTSLSKWLLRVGLITFALAALTGAGNAQTVYPHHAGLVIKFGDGSVYTKCIDLGDDGQATGYEVLQAAGDLTLIADFSYGLGAAVCKINQQGCNFPAEQCFCQCRMTSPNDACRYWSYWHLTGNNWQYSQLGASNYTVHSAAVEGWAWGDGTTTSATQPPLLTFDQICAPATATPTATPTATATATATATPTATPTVAPSPSPTPSEESAQPAVAPPVQIATPAPAVGSTVTPRPTLPPRSVPQTTPTPGAAELNEANGAPAASTPLPTPAPTSSPAPAATIVTVAQANLAAAPHAHETPTSLPSAMNAVVVSTAEPALARTEPTTNPLIWIIFGGVVVSLVIGLILLQRATRPTS